MTELQIVLVLAIAAGAAFFFNRFIEMQHDIRRREDSSRRIQAFIAAAKQNQGMVNQMQEAIPPTEIADILAEASLSELSAIQEAITAAENEISQMRRLFTPQIALAAQNAGITLQLPAPQKQSQGNNNQQAQNR